VTIAVEGVICLLMAAPIACVLALFGGFLAYAIHNNSEMQQPSPATFAVLVLALPLMLGAEHAAPPPVPRFQEGLTADRECHFSTGNFREPILTWEPGKHFAFAVADEPLLMKETSPYGDIHVRHLEDHDFQPERADFLLVRLPNGGTRLEGTTTYQNKMWPGLYWRIWTDAVVHSIHRRVFEHVKMLAESDAGEAAPSGASD
jgi:hypothetical protein